MYDINMNRTKLIYSILGITVGSLLTLFMTTNLISNNFKIRQTVSNSLDKHFIEQMIPHHEGAIDMAKLAQKRSKNTNVLNLSESIIQSQSQEIIKMQTWYKDWYGKIPTSDSNLTNGMGRGMMHGGMMGGNTADTDLLENSKNFDEDFLKEMIPHHQMAVMMAQMLLSGTDTPEMMQLAQDIIKAQETEITQMRSWLFE